MRDLDCVKDVVVLGGSKELKCCQSIGLEPSRSESQNNNRFYCWDDFNVEK